MRNRKKIGKTGRRLKNNLPPGSFRILLLTTILAISFLVYFNSIVIKLEDNTRAVSDLYAAFYASAASPDSGNDLNVIFEQVLPRIDFPVILMDSHGVPFQYRNITPAEGISDTTGWLMKTAERLDKENPPIELKLQPGDILIGTLHYGVSPLTREIRWVPRLLVFLAMLYLFSAFNAYRIHRAGIEHSVWIGMARETAHQLGTPLTSLMAWAELLEEKAGDEKDEELIETVKSMETDIERLTSIADRFEKIGVLPRLEIGEPAIVVREAVDYFGKRMDAFGNEVELYLNIEENLPELKMNGILLGWVLEITLMNALDACANRGNGKISVEVSTDEQRRKVIIKIRDNGRGMSRKEMRSAFQPGFTTKRRGWGMGLAFAKRIICVYHGGSIYFSESSPENGTTLEIVLNVPERSGFSGK